MLVKIYYIMESKRELVFYIKQFFMKIKFYKRYNIAHKKISTFIDSLFLTYMYNIELL